mgnify:CR=1 FL=1|jgi:hypothetical protein
MNLETLENLSLSNLLDVLIADLHLLQPDGDLTKLSEETEEVIGKLSIHKKLVEDLDKKVKAKLIEDFKAKPGLKKVEGDKMYVGYVKVNKTVIDDESSVPEGFFETKKVLNTKAVNDYEKMTGELPAGLKKDGFEYISFKEI